MPSINLLQGDLNLTLERLRALESIIIKIFIWANIWFYICIYIKDLYQSRHSLNFNFLLTLKSPEPLKTLKTNYLQFSRNKRTSPFTPEQLQIQVCALREIFMALSGKKISLKKNFLWKCTYMCMYTLPCREKNILDIHMYTFYLCIYIYMYITIKKVVINSLYMA